MSKHRTQGTNLRRLLSGILCLALVLGLLPAGTILPAQAAHWADPYGQQLVEWGVMRGDISGNLNLNNPITRAEFVAMMNRAYGYTKKGGHPFTDVRSTDWFSDDIDIAYNIGYFKGTSDTTASPYKALTREQAAVLLARNMMLQETVGETLGFSDSRTLSEWSRGLVGAAAASGIISGYKDGTFQPFRNITRGEVAAMLTRSIGTPIQTPGDHALGNVYGNVTVNTSGVKLRDGVIAGNLYLTGGIDLGEVLLENITVLGEIIVSGGGESNSSQSSIIMRNVTADGMTVDSIGSQFVTLRAEGVTDIPLTTVRTNAFVDDSALPGYGLSRIELDGEDGTLLQVAGSVKEVWNHTPGSSLQIVQGSANKVTIDEKAVGSNVLVDGDARVDDLNLDVATNVTGTGDIKNLNVGAAGSIIEQLPDKIEIRPGIDADINGSNMNSTQAAESSSDPKLLAGYPSVKNIAPNSATLVFKANKTGTIYWAVSAVADGSVSEADLLEPPVYGGKILKAGTINATAANREFTAAVTELTKDGSYYVTAMLVDGRKQHSPIKVTSFTTPDDSEPAFAEGYPVMSKVTCDQAQVTVMTTKSCQLYYALLPAGAAAPTPAEFKSAAIPGNLGYGSQSVTKSVTTPINVNSFKLDEKTDYVLYLWLTDHDGAKSSPVESLEFTTPDETPPIVTDMRQTACTVNSITMDYTIDEPANLVWAIVTEGNHNAQQFLNFDWTEKPDPTKEDVTILEFSSEAQLLAAKVRLMNAGTAAIQSSSTTNRSPFTINGLDPATNKTSSYVLYYIANDQATTNGNLSTQIKAIRVHTEDLIHPTVKLSFTNPGGTEVTEEPQSDANIRILFSENVQAGTKKDSVFLSLYERVKAAESDLAKSQTDDEKAENQAAYDAAKTDLAAAFKEHITLRFGPAPGTNPVPVVGEKKTGSNDTVTPDDKGSWVNWRNAQVSMLEDGTLEILLRNVDQVQDKEDAAVQLESGIDYYFHMAGIYDLAATPNDLLEPHDLEFKTQFVKVLLEESDTWKIDNAPADTSGGKNDPSRADFSFTALPTTVEKVGEDIYWDMLIWSDTSITFTIYFRDLDKDGKPTGDPWTCLNKDGKPASITVSRSDGYSYVSLWRVVEGYGDDMPPYEDDKLHGLGNREYAIHIDSLGGTSNTDYTAWNGSLNLRISYMAGSANRLFTYVRSGTQVNYDNALANGVTSIEQKSPFFMNKPFEVMKAPEILDGFPTISVTDTGAKINLALDKAGQVYYLVLPMTQMYKADGTAINNQTTLLTEDGTDAVIPQIDRFNMRYTPTIKEYKAINSTTPGSTTGLTEGAADAIAKPVNVPRMIGGGVDSSQKRLAVSIPDQTNVIDGGLASSFPQDVAPAKAARPREEITIDLTDQLAANTIYYVFLVTRSESAIYSDDPLCFRFTTSEPIRPNINVDGGGGTTVNITVDKTTNLTYILSPNGEEGGSFGDNFSQWADTDRWYASGSTGNTTPSGWTVPVPDPTTGTYGSWEYGEYNFTYTQNKGDIKKMTVVDAMATPCYKGSALSKDNYAGSVFDIFATSNAKNFFQSAIVGANIGDNSIAAKGEKICNVPPASNSETFTGLAPGYYTFLCVGSSAQGSGYAFRAYYSIRVQDNSHPTVTTSWSKGTDWGYGKLSGKITLLFSDPLYFAQTTGGNPPTRRETYKLDSATTSTTHDKQVCLTDVVTLTPGLSLLASTDHTKTGPQIITLNFTNLMSEGNYYCYFTKGLCTSTGQGSDDQLVIKIHVKATPKDTTGITNPGMDDKWEYSLEITIEPQSIKWQQGG